MKISALCTYTDWTDAGGCWGKAGTKRIFDYLKAAGIENIYWRVYNGGLAMYPSKIASVQSSETYSFNEVLGIYKNRTTARNRDYMQGVDFNSYDPLPDALESAEDNGINLHLWYTIYEDDHGGGFLSEFARNNPAYWQMDREGLQYRGTLDWFFEEVRRYKLAIVKELLSYGAKGIMLDFLRHNATASCDENGRIHRMGYNPEIREYYKKEKGVDPADLPADDKEWINFKRGVTGDLLKEVAGMVRESNSGSEIGLLLPSCDCKNLLCLDVSDLTENGFIDLVTVQNPLVNVSEQLEIIAPQVKGGKTRLIPSICCYPAFCINAYYPPQLETIALEAEKAGKNELMLYESDAIIRADLTGVIKAIHAGVPNNKRVITALRTNEKGMELIDWKALRVYSGFLKDDATVNQDDQVRTEFQFAFNSKELFVRFRCYEPGVKAGFEEKSENFNRLHGMNFLRARNAVYLFNSFNLLIDPCDSNEDFYLFGVLPGNQRIQESFYRGILSCEWSSEVNVREDSWGGCMVLPFESLGRPAPSDGEVWGINLIRGIAGRDETVRWFYSFTGGRMPVPSSLGNIEFKY